MKLDGKVALVTGGARGIGRAICLALAAEGADVAVNYRSSDAAAKELVAELVSGGRRAIAVAGDVADPEAAHEITKRAIAELGGLHILVNNAGIANDKLIFHMTADDWQSVMAVNFGGVFNGTKAVQQHFMRQGEGAIVNISSVMSERGWVGQANYAASKGAINAFTRCAAIEFARFGIRVNAVLPGFTPTDLVAELVDKGTKGIKKQVPLRGFARVEDIAGMVVHLAGPDAAYTTGATISVDGGAGAQLGLGRPEW
ncbi:3-oxoacyl-ACP reductase family protein [Nocardia suismassiliense]|uniref:3-oxoacyl-ACP reductase family protein n=1 Tax=Nocardia suismassiliense TaxID=2077092 RepID=UPI000D1E12B6|nr:3-oxoacyl-ACP reductase family protein [Nocardia suismassiliense]